MKKVYSATVTPLLADGSLDESGLSNILERNIRHGLSGVFLLGSMGEWGSFSDEFKLNLVARATEIVGDRLELLVGINATSLPLSLQLMRSYEQFSFDSFVFMLPARTSALNPVKSILNILDSADRPVYYYHCPPNNDHNLSLEQFAEIMKHPNLRGIKNSASNMWLRRELLLLREDIGSKCLLLEGQEWACDEALIAGNDGMLCGIGALASKILVKIARAVDKTEVAQAVQTQNQLIRVFHGIYGKNLESVLAGQKYALKKLQLIENELTLAQEMTVLSDGRKTEIEKCLEEFKDALD